MALQGPGRVIPRDTTLGIKPMPTLLHRHRDVTPVLHSATCHVRLLHVLPLLQSRASDRDWPRLGAQCSSYSAFESTGDKRAGQRVSDTS